jgi:hypothetical protein
MDTMQTKNEPGLFTNKPGEYYVETMRFILRQAEFALPSGKIFKSL